MNGLPAGIAFLHLHQVLRVATRAAGE
jgi:hypothetical protein